MKLNKKDIQIELHQKAIEAISELKIRKIVNRKGVITKKKTAGQKGKKIVGGRVKTVSSAEKRNRRLGKIKLKRTLKSKSVSAKKKSIRFAVKGRAKRKSLGIK